MLLEGRNFCQNGLAEQCEKERSNTFDGNQVSSERGKDALCTVQALWDHQQGVSKHLALYILCVLAPSSFPWLVPNTPSKALHNLGV